MHRYIMISWEMDKSWLDFDFIFKVTGGLRMLKKCFVDTQSSEGMDGLNQICPDISLGDGQELIRCW